ncbi:hypothetical protein GCM10022261_11090 [Brevibacterium daeguense]|uniref:Uncharacterized protein n=1 Tax=Brevibacterium daeguense TaxID=909936 RepID=A0ABP8EHZ9_9MICO
MFVLGDRAVRLFFAAALVVVLTVASVPLLNVLVYSPARTVSRYLSAVENGDAARALGLLAAPETATTDALDAQVLANAPSLPHQIDIVDSEVEDSTATVTARYNLGNSSHESEFSLVKAGSAFGLYDRWLIRIDEWPRISLNVRGSQSAQINGVSAPVDRGPIPVLFPVAYDVGFNADYLRSEITRTELLNPGAVAEVTLHPAPTEELRQEVQRQVNAQLDTCAEAKTLLPAGCTFGYETNHQILGDVSWRVVRYPEVKLSSEGSELVVTETEAELEITGRYRDIVTAYESDFTERLSVELSASVRVTDGAVTVQPHEPGQLLG